MKASDSQLFIIFVLWLSNSGVLISFYAISMHAIEMILCICQFPVFIKVILSQYDVSVTSLTRPVQVRHSSETDAIIDF